MEMQDKSREKFLEEMAEAYKLQDTPRDIFLKRFAYKEQPHHKNDQEFAKEQGIGKTTLSSHMNVIYGAFTKSSERPYACDIDPNKRGRGKFNKLNAWLWTEQFPLWRDHYHSWKERFPITVIPKISNSVPKYVELTVTDTNDIASNIPYTIVSSDRFFGRSQEISELHNLLQQHDWVAITGMTGIGKTELAIQYTQQYKSDYPGGICWVDADDNVVFQLIEFSRTYFPHFKLREGLDATNQIKCCWQQWQEGKVLIVIDNVTDYNKEVKLSLPPQLSRFKVLIITEEKLSIVRLDLEALKPQDALDLLRALVISERIERELAVAEQLCEWVGYLPLALELVGYYLKEDEDLLFVEMLQQLEEKKLRHKALIKTEPTMRIQLGVEATFELSWQRLDKNIQHLAYLLSLFNSAPILWEFVESIEIGKDSEELTEARRALIRFSLLRRVDKKTYKLHQLVREFIKYKLAESADAITIKEAFNDAMFKELLKVAQKILKEPDFVISRPIKDDFILQRYLIEAIPKLEKELTGEEQIKLFKSQFVHVLHIHCKSVTSVVQAILRQRQILEILPNGVAEDYLPLFLHNDNTLIPVLKFSGNWFQKINNIDAVKISKALEIVPIPVGAEYILNATLQLLKKEFGESHPDTIEVHKTLTLLHAYYGKWNWLK